MKIYLLTHSREIDRKTNTGLLALETSNGFVERVIWDRVNPCEKLIELIKSKNTALLYPNSESKTKFNLNHYDNIILLDATWQEAKKMYNQSGYLKAIDKISLSNTQPSHYQLRKNQPKGGLCTIECVIELFKLNGNFQTVEKLQSEFINFNNLR